MLQKLLIRNFQCWKKLDIDIAHGITTVCGSSDVGKSALVRILQWIATNKPTGDSFVRDGATKAIGQLISENNTITRIRGKGINIYKLNDRVFTAFGNDVPKPIAKVLRMSDINFQKQHDLPFWFSETAGEVSRQLNRIINLDIIDISLANIGVDVRTNNASTEICKERLAKARAQVKELTYITIADRELTIIEQLQDRVQTIGEKADLLGGLSMGAIRWRKGRDIAATACKYGNIALKAGQALARVTKQLDQLQSLVTMAGTLKEVITAAPPPIGPLKRLYAIYSKATERVIILLGLIRDTKIYKEQLCEARSEEKELLDRMRKVAGKRCPLCGKPMTL